MKKEQQKELKFRIKVDTIPISTEVTDEDLENAITIDGAKYSRDKKRLLEGDNISDFSILPGTEVICDDAFYGCENLQQITIPNSVTHIGRNPFAECYNIRLECHSNHFIIDGKALFNKERNRIISCMSNDSTFTIPNSVTHIGDDAFSWCKKLQQITIPNSVTNIDISAFWGCKNLQQITIPCGARAKFEKLLPKYHQLLKEMD